MMVAILTVIASAIVMAYRVLAFAFRVLFVRHAPIAPARIVKTCYRARCSRCGYTYDRDLGACLCTWVR
jgi:hypothetical protein